MKTIEEKDLQELRMGNTKPLTKIFEQNYAYCTNHISMSTNCSLHDAEDLVMDAIIVLHEKIMLDSFVNDNVQAFILKVASNMWSNQNKRNRRKLPFDPKIIERFLSKNEDHFVLDDDRQRQVNITLSALKKLGDPCESILRRSIIDRIPLRNLAEELGISNKDVLKTTKARCKKKLKALINEMLNKNKNE